MSLFKNILTLPASFSSLKRSIVHQNQWNAVACFGSRIEVPTPPKRPLTAYMIYCKENRKNLLKENPSLSSPEQIKILAKKWSHLTIDMKKPYEVSARENTLLYGELHKKFYENLTEEQKEELIRLKAKKKESRRMFKIKKALRDSGLPKTPNTAYALFVQAEAKKQHVTHPSEFLKKAAELWKSLPENVKEEFKNQAQEDKKRYVAEMKEWQKKMEAEGNENLIKVCEELKWRPKALDADELPPTKKPSKTLTKAKVDSSKN